MTVSDARWYVLSKHFPKNHVYVNCWSNRTAHKVMAEILRQLGQVVHGRESENELIRRFKAMQKKLAICLDEADQLRDKRILYELAPMCPLVLVSNHPYTSMEFDSRIKSRLFMREIEFRPYKEEDLVEILNQRAFTGLRPQSVENHILGEIARSSKGDVRMGMDILLSAAKEAENKGEEKVDLNHIKSVSKTSRKYRLSYLLKKLSSHQRIIFDILRKRGSMDSGDLYREYFKMAKKPLTDRSYRNCMKRLIELGLVREISSGRWKKYELV